MSWTFTIEQIVDRGCKPIKVSYGLSGVNGSEKFNKAFEPGLDHMFEAIKEKVGAENA